MPSYLLFGHISLGWALFAQNPPGAKFVFGKQCRVQWNLVPVGERIARFHAKALVLKVAVESFLGDFECNAKTIRQAHFDFFSEEMVRRSVTECVPLVNDSGINRAWRQHIRVSQIRKTAARKSRRRTISAW